MSCLCSEQPPARYFFHQQMPALDACAIHMTLFSDKLSEGATLFDKEKPQINVYWVHLWWAIKCHFLKNKASDFYFFAISS